MNNPMITFDPTIALGSMLHLVILLAALGVISWRLGLWLKRVEKKQDKIIDAFTKERSRDAD